MNAFDAIWFLAFFGPLLLVRIVRTIFTILRAVAP